MSWATITAALQVEQGWLLGVRGPSTSRSCNRLLGRRVGHLARGPAAREVEPHGSTEPGGQKPARVEIAGSARHEQPSSQHATPECRTATQG
eukprot:8732027-Alexandrium_andersonii.AAC.1